jgi:hypothetical protein
VQGSEGTKAEAEAEADPGQVYKRERKMAQMGADGGQRLGCLDCCGGDLRYGSSCVALRRLRR